MLRQVLLLVAAIGGIIAASFYVISFAITVVFCFALVFFFCVGFFYTVSKVPVLANLMEVISNAFRAKTLTDVQDALTRKYNADQAKAKEVNPEHEVKLLKITDDQLKEGIKIDMKFAYAFIFFSTLDIITDAVYAVITSFINPAMHLAVVLFLLLPMMVLFVQHQVSLSSANRPAANPFLRTTLHHHVKKGYSTTDGVN